MRAQAEAEGRDSDQVTVEFVRDFAIHVPLIIICELMGLDPQQRLSMYAWSDNMMAGDGHIEADDPVLHAAAESFGEYAMMCLELIAERRADPKDDLISILTQAFDAGDLTKEHKALQGITKEELAERDNHSGLNDDELLAFLAVLLVAAFLPFPGGAGAVEAGLVGKKSGAGFYEYADNGRVTKKAS